MAENLGGRFATMSEEERRRFAMEQEQEQEQQQGEAQRAENDPRQAEGERGDELEFDDPRRDHQRTKADLEDRDGTGALVDDDQHAAARVKEARGRAKPGRPPV